MTVILFLVVLAILVFVHELGHFTAAKIFGIRVDEFAIGFPPKIFGWRKGETEYKLNLIPLGGYVKIFGEDPNEDSMSGPDSKRSFVNASKWKQIVVLLSGIFMNIFFAWILISASFNFGLITAIDDSIKNQAQSPSVMILSVLKDSPSDKAGLKDGDYIIKMISDGVEYGSDDPADISVSEIQNVISNNKNGYLDIFYKRNGEVFNTRVSPSLLNVSEDKILNTNEISGKKLIGISMSSVGTIKFGFFKSMVEGAKLTYSETINITKGIYNLIVGAIKGEKGLFSQITGPIGIAGMVGEASGIGISYLLGFIAMISINLAILNLVPFPALDGGRVLFVLIEVIIRKKIKPAIANWFNLIGFILLISLMIFVTYKDILKLF
jgi:regulator of sigma E protease